MASTTATKHPFGELLAQYRARRPGLTQTRLAELAGYDQAILTRMAQGKKDLTGPSGRERILRIIETLADQNAIATLDEANALLLAADLPPLFERQPAEAKLIARFGKTPAGFRTRRTNLPALVSSFIGRAAELAEVRALLNTSRLVTLTGSGGAGKTRLAQRVAGDVLLFYPDGVWYVELAALSEGGLIADAAMRAMGLVPSDQPALERIVEHLRERHALLVLDNCERLIDGVAEFAIAVLHACPRVTILATSREALDVEGERAWRVPPMQPDEASRLFAERAIAIHSALNAGDETITHICQRLDGMPLAIELAASRLQVMSLSDIAARLDDRFTLLAHGRRGALPRHQTLRAMIDWSYEFLSEPEQIAFRRLGVFVGGWEIDLATSRIGKDALALLTQLASKSLVVVDEADGQTRYRYLETIREYALEKLREAGEMQVAQRSHAESVAALVERAEQPLRGREQKQWLDRINRDRTNLDAALTWCFGPDGDAWIGCRIVSMLKVVWLSSPATLSAERWVNTAMAAMTDDMPVRVRAALHMMHTGFNFSGTQQEVIATYELALRLYQEANDLVGMVDVQLCIVDFRLSNDVNDAGAWKMLLESINLADAANDSLITNYARLDVSYWAQTQNRFDEAEAMARAGIQGCRETGDFVTLTRMLFQLGHCLADQLRFEEAMPCFEEAAAIARDLNDPLSEMNALGALAEVCRFAGNLPRALILNEQAVALGEAYVHPLDVMLPMIWQAKALNDAGEHDLAIECLLKVIRWCMRSNIRIFLGHIEVFDAFACVYSGQGNALKAARIAGAADRCLASLNRRRLNHNVREYAPYIAKARAALGDEAYEAARAEGRAMSLDEAYAYVFDGES